MTTAIVPMIETSNNELVVSSEQIAIGAGVEHRATLQLIKTNQAELEEFGQVAFEMRLTGKAGSDIRVALLNEPQAMLLMAFQRNTPQVKAFKVALVKEFYRMKQVIAHPAVQEALFNTERSGFTVGQPVHKLPALASRAWVDPRTIRNNQIAEITRNANGAWVPFTIDGFGEQQYRELAKAIRYGARSSFPRGHYQAAPRPSNIYIRHNNEVAA